MNNALAALLVFALPTAQAQSAPDPNAPLEPSDLEFRILGQQTGAFFIATPGGNEAVRYDVGAGRVSFRTLDFVAESTYSVQGTPNPLFCFDFSDAGGPQPRLDVTDSNGLLALNGVRLDSGLRYRLDEGVIEFTPGPQTQCFFVGEDGDAVFGLYGMAPPPPREDPTPLVFQDRFELFTDPHLTVSFESIPSAVTAGGLLDYTLIIENTGDMDLSSVAFQEVFPSNTSVFPAALTAGNWTCSGATCPETTGTGLIRFSGVSLAVGQSMSFQIERPVAATAQGGARIALFAGAVNGAGVAASFGADQVEVPVIGQPAQLAFVGGAPSLAVGGSTELTIELQDIAGIRIPGDNRTIQVTKVFVSNQGQVGLPNNGLLALGDGRVQFPVEGVQAGNIRLRAQTASPGSIEAGELDFVVTIAP